MTGKSVSKFCQDWGISRAGFYNAMRRSEAPATMLVGGRRLISEEAEDAWRRKREAAAAAALAAREHGGR
jgi:hypothetical protein